MSRLHRPRRLVRTAAGLAVAALALSGCSFRGAASFPLPGGAGGGGYQVKIEFRDVLDLVPQSAVKVDDVTVGTVKKIELTKDGYTALVTVSVDKKVDLPENATASLRQTSLLGEKFVSLNRPANPVGRLRNGMYIPLSRTERNADIEEVLGALSLVINGGSIEQLQVINSELTKALAGREPQVRDFLRQLTGFVGGLDAQKTHITAALDGLDRLSTRLAARRQTLDVALRDLPQGAAVLADERAQLTKVLAGLNNLGTVATRVIQATQENTIADLKALQPVLGQLAAAGKDLPDALELITTYPFPRTVSDPVGRGGIRGDYANLYITIDSSVTDALGNLLGGLPLPAPLPSLPGLPLQKGAATPKPTTGATPLPVPSLPVQVPLGNVVGSDPTGLIRMLLGGLS
jgi:phospholipid/cholesterol/gamma-HCH transport system substrate-binding protein